MEKPAAHAAPRPCVGRKRVFLFLKKDVCTPAAEAVGKTPQRFFSKNSKKKRNGRRLLVSRTTVHEERAGSRATPRAAAATMPRRRSSAEHLRANAAASMS